MTLNFSFKVSALFGLGLLDLSPIFSLFLYLFHHGDLLRLHLSNLLLHGLCLQLLLVECLRQPGLLSLLILQLLQFGLQLNLLLLVLLLDAAFLGVARRLLQGLSLLGIEASDLVSHQVDLLVVLLSHLLQQRILHLFLLLLDLL